MIPLVDLIVDHHTHVVQPIERVNGVRVVYGLGNAPSNRPSNQPGSTVSHLATD